MPKLSRRKLLLALAICFGLILRAAPLVAQTKSLPIQITVDLRDAPRHIFHARLEMPVKPGPLTLVYPEWVPGEHGPTGPIADLAGLKFSVAGKPLSWWRDEVDMYAFHLEVPAGASSLDVTLDYLSPIGTGHFSASPASTAHVAVLNWNSVLLYPAGTKSDDVMFAPRLILPTGWKFGTALETAKESPDGIEFHAVSLTTLVDSPLNAGAYFRSVALSPDQAPPHRLDIAGDSAAAVNITEELTARYKHLVEESGALFGARHYRHYDFLLSLSDHLTSFGLEHHQSSDNRAAERALLDPYRNTVFATLLSHEFVHSWNGKYRRPAGLATPNYQEPMRGELLWVYEGLTQYLGNILAARSGLWTPEQYREHLAWVAAYLNQRPGRTWRPLQDTAIAAQTLYGSREDWQSWRRSVDFYDESDLIWLEADAIIRTQTQGRHSLDDFCRRFHGGQSGPPAVVRYTFDDVVATLQDVAPYDWRAFLRSRLDSTAPGAPLGGIDGSGWRLVFTDTPNENVRAQEVANKTFSALFSLGFTLKYEENTKENGMILDVTPGTPAARAGIGPGMRLVAVNGRAWTPNILREALRAAKDGTEPIELLVENEDSYQTYRIAYREGERYPHLVREASKADLLEQILLPRAAGTREKPR